MAEPKGNYLGFLGRISPEKRPDRAIAIARRAGLKLEIAAKVDTVDRAYFADVIEPLLSEPGSSSLARSVTARSPRFLATPQHSCFRSTGRSRSVPS